MGLIKAITSSVSQTLGDQFKEFVTCPSIDSNVLIQRGIVNHGKGNKNPSEGVISNGSAIVVPEGMAMMIIDNGEIKEFTATPGTFTYDTSSEPSIFTGKLGEGIKNTFKTIGKRFTYGGMPARDQRVYYVNLLVITGNKFGSPQPKKITDEKYGMLEVTFFGEYAFQVKDPMRLVNTVIGANANKIDDASIFSDKNLQSGLMASATADAMKTAAGNDNGAMAGFMGMNMAGNVEANVMGAVNTSNEPNNTQSSNSNTVSSTDNQKPKFCPNCGAATNGGNFCAQCGTKLS